MSIISRLTTWTIGQVLKAADLNGEFNNITNLFNNLDAGTTTWTNVKAGTLVSTTATALKGSATNDSASAGNVGEYIESIANTSTAASTTWGDVTSISLTAGDWELTAINYFNSGTTITVAQTGISLTTGNSSTGLVAGSNLVVDNITGLTTHDYSQVVSGYRLSLSGTTTVYLKENGTYVGSFTCSGRLSARRMR